MGQPRLWVKSRRQELSRRRRLRRSLCRKLVRAACRTAKKIRGRRVRDHRWWRRRVRHRDPRVMWHIFRQGFAPTARVCVIVQLLQELSPPDGLCRRPGGLMFLLRGRAARGRRGPGRCLHHGSRFSPCDGVRDRTQGPRTVITSRVGTQERVSVIESPRAQETDKSRRAHEDVCRHKARSEGQVRDSRPATSLRGLPLASPCSRCCHGCAAEAPTGALPRPARVGAMRPLMHDTLTYPHLRGGGRGRKKPTGNNAVTQANSALAQQVEDLLSANPSNLAQRLTALLAAFAREQSAPDAGAQAPWRQQPSMPRRSARAGAAPKGNDVWSEPTAAQRSQWEQWEQWPQTREGEWRSWQEAPLCTSRRWSRRRASANAAEEGAWTRHAWTLRIEDWQDLAGHQIAVADSLEAFGDLLDGSEDISGVVHVISEQEAVEALEMAAAAVGCR